MLRKPTGVAVLDKNSRAAAQFTGGRPPPEAFSTPLWAVSGPG
jgi:hypothetical protein